MATIQISTKVLGKKKSKLQNLPLEIPNLFFETPTLQHFISIVVRQQVELYNQKREKSELLPYLDQAAMNTEASTGKIGFGEIYNDTKADVDKAVEVAIQAFIDGLYFVIIDKQKIEKLTDEITLTEGSEVIFLRLVALVGSYF